MPLPAPGQQPQYLGTFDCAKKTVQREGFRGLYKGLYPNLGFCYLYRSYMLTISFHFVFIGMSAPLTGVAPIFAMSFFGFGLGKRLQQKTPNEELTNLQILGAGAFSGIFTTTIMAPGERIKCLLQIQQGGNAPQKYNGMVHCATSLVRYFSLTF